MNSELSDIADELFEECGFWAKFTGEVRRPAAGWPGRAYWLARVIVRGLILALRPSRMQPSRVANAPCDVLLIYVTENQRRALLPWIGLRTEFQTASQMPGADWSISWAQCGRLMLHFALPTYLLLNSRPDRATTLPWLEDFVRYSCALVLARDLYRRADPRIVVVSNDHSGFFRAFIRAARERHCRVVYTQHGSIGRNFPRLDFDLALLDGMQAYLHYRESGEPRGAVLITGRNRPEVAARPAASTDETIHVGVATNWDDSLFDWFPLLRLMASRFKRVTFRCHPAEPRRLAWRFLCWLSGVEFDTGTLRDFLARQSVLISGRSGIVLDAALSGVPSLVKSARTHTSPQMADYFGYSRFGLCRTFVAASELPQLVRSCANQKVDPENVAAYDAGLVQDPIASKRAALDTLVRCVQRGADISRELAGTHVSVRQTQHTVLMSSEYAMLNRKHGWLPDTTAVSVRVSQ